MAITRFPEDKREKVAGDLDENLGSGFNWPPIIEDGGTVGVTSGKDHISSCIKRGVLYDHLDLVGVPSFGGGLPSKVFKVMGISDLGGIEEQVKDHLENWENRIENVRVTAGKSEDSVTEIVVVAQYSVRVTGEDEAMTFPLRKG